MKLKRARKEKKLPEVFSTQEIAALVGNVRNLKHRSILITAYSAGLRVSEVGYLQPADIDSDRMQQWIMSSRNFFVPLRALSKIFRAAFYQLMEKALYRQELLIADQDQELYSCLPVLKKDVYRQWWNVHIKKTFRGAGQVVSYLGRHTHRVAISNNRLLSMEAGVIKFRWKDYRDHRWKIMELQAHSFIRRFLQHILPSGYYKIRYYGVFSSAHSKTSMPQCFALLRATPAIPQYE